MTKKTAWAMTGILRSIASVTGTAWIKHELQKIIREDRAAWKKAA